MKERVLVGLSGGVDSAVGAYLLKKKGYEVIGVYLKLHPYHDDTDARNVAEKLDIEFLSIDLQKEFRASVMDDFVSEYEKGRTPNPCVQCNKYIKFGELFHIASKQGASFVASGHYAQIHRDESTGKYTLKSSKASQKDQTYMLYHLTQDKLEKILFPLGDMESKEEVRKIAQSIGLDVSDKEDSQEICFIPDNDYTGWLAKEKSDFPIGDFVTVEGKILGKHKGIHHYTIGQRKGLGVNGGPFYVTQINGKNANVILGNKDQVFSNYAWISEVNFLMEEPAQGQPVELEAKVRSTAKPSRCQVIKTGEEVKVIFHKPERAVTPGQSLVLYQGDFVYGGGIIERVE